MAAFLLWQVAAYAIARSRVRRECAPATDGEWDLLERLCAEMGVRQSLGLCRWDRVRSPMLLGLFSPLVILPHRDSGPDELEAVLRHELCHLKRGDVAYKAFLLLCNAVHWFNPLVWLMTRAAARNVEFCCDDQVLRHADGPTKKHYGEVLLHTAAASIYPAFSTQFGSGKEQLKARLLNLFRPKKNSAALVCVVTVAALLAGGLVACESDEMTLPDTIPTVESPVPTPTIEPTPDTAADEIDPSERIPELLGIICTPSAQSNPLAYIEAHTAEYDELLSCGEATLNYCGKQFERGAAIDLEGAVMAYLCCDLLGIDRQTVVECVTGQYWYDTSPVPYRTDSVTGERTYYISTGEEEPESTPALSREERDAKMWENLREWDAATDALRATRERYSPLEGRPIGDYIVLAANQRWPDEVISPEPPSAHIMKKENDEWHVVAWMDSAKVGTVGFSAAVLRAEGMTLVVGDLGEKLARNEDPDDLVAPNDVEIVVDTDQGKYGTRARGGSYFFMVLDRTLDVTDIHLSEKGEEITSYQKAFGEAPPSGAERP